jgi:mRNA-degrading endonuclease RelE of RelBE toxin-antitoxin system
MRKPGASCGGCLNYRVEWKPRALKQAAVLDRKQRERVFAAVERLATTG